MVAGEGERSAVDCYFLIVAKTAKITQLRAHCFVTILVILIPVQE